MRIQRRGISASATFCLVISFVLAMACTANAQTPTPGVPGLISHWSGENNANDSVGSNNGVQVGNVTYTAGQVGQAFSFSNPTTSGYVQTPTTNLPTGNSDRTMELWVKINSYRSSGESVLAAYGTFAASNQLYFLGTLSDGRVYFSQWGQSITGPQLQLGLWYHVAVTNVGNFTTLYVNGQSVASGNQSINTSSGSSLVIGRTPAFTAGYGDYGFNGAIDEVKIFNRALNNTEIQHLYNARAQIGTFFVTKDNATEYTVFRYQVTPTTSPVLEATITDSSLIYPIGLTLSPSGELFVVNQGTPGFVARFLNPTGTSAFNGNIPAGPEITFYGAFRGNELFVSQRFSGVLRFIIDPVTGQATPNGQIPIHRTIGEFRGIVVTPWGELFVSEIGPAGVTGRIHRITFDTNGNAQPNGVISNSNVEHTHGMVFSPWGELFVTSPLNNSIGRFTFDAAKNASFNGSITGGGMSYPLDVSFAPWGELFVGNCMCRDASYPPGAYQGISRFKFDTAHVASSNGTVTTPFPISGITFVPAPYDSTGPATTAAQTPNANAAGWNNSNVNVSLSSADDTGGTGVSNITYSATGAQTVPQTVVNGTSASLAITAEGGTTITYFARDNAGNPEASQTLVVRIDKTAPLITSQATTSGNPYTSGTWTNQNVVVSFACTDALSGVASVTQPITLSSEGGNQTANGVCTDAAGNSANASSVNISIDKTAPVITVTAPTNGGYLLNQAVATSYTCADGGSGVASCTGTTANGGSLNTGSIGGKTFSVNATDHAGNSASPTVVNYTVGFGIQILFDQTKAHKSGSTVPIKIRLVDANGVNVSSATTVVHAVSVIQTGSQASPILDDAGNANPDFDFRYDQSSEGYIFNLKTTGYGTGTYQLNFIAGSSPTTYAVQFQVRQ